MREDKWCRPARPVPRLVTAAKTSATAAGNPGGFFWGAVAGLQSHARHRDEEVPATALEASRPIPPRLSQMGNSLRKRPGGFMLAGRQTAQPVTVTAPLLLEVAAPKGLARPPG